MYFIMIYYSIIIHYTEIGLIIYCRLLVFEIPIDFLTNVNNVCLNCNNI